MAQESIIAVFVDFENLALGVRDLKGGGFNIGLVLKRLLEKGRLVYKRAYCDWTHYRKEVRDFHEQGIELIDIPQRRTSGKNSADIRMVVDALDLCHSKAHIDTFALVSGDSDFSPLVSKLKENDKRVIGCGIKASTSDLLIGNCDEFIYYDDLAKAASKTRERTQKRSTKKKSPSGSSSGSSSSGNGSTKKKAAAKSAPPKKEKKPTTAEAEERREEARERLVEVLDSIEQDYDIVWGSSLKQILRRVYPGFNEDYYGFSSFSELLEDAADHDMIDLDYDESRRNYQVRLVD